MQSTVATSLGPAGELLAQRTLGNRVVMLDFLTRVETLQGEARNCLGRSKSLRLEVRRNLDLATAGIVSTKAWCASQPAVVFGRFPRFSAPPRNPVDVARSEMHAEYAATCNSATRDELMSSYDGFARSLALKFRHRESIDDLVQVARIGLLHAIDRFDPELGRPFPLFARITITGELKRHLRDKTWTMRVPRSLQEDYLSVMRAVDDLTGEQSDSPTVEAVAERCDLSVDRVLEAMELRVAQRALSIDAPVTFGSDDAVLEPGAVDAGFARLENQELLGHLLDRLSTRDRRIIELRFVDELTQAEIAEQIGVSQMCVSRVLARTLGRLRLWARTAVA